MPPRRSVRNVKATAAPAAATPAVPPAATPPTTAVVVNPLPLKGTRITTSGAFAGILPTAILNKAAKLGAATSSNITKTVTHMICTEHDYENNVPYVRTAKTFNTKIVLLDWLEECEATKSRVDEETYLLENNVTTNGNKRSAAADDDDDDDKDDKPASKRTKTAASKPKTKAGTQRTVSPPTAKAVNVSKLNDIKDKGSHGQKATKNTLVIPLDDGVANSLGSGWAVYISNDGIIYDASLNQTNAGNNNNKFYRVQIVYRGSLYQTWTRYGRVGESGQSRSLGNGDLASALKEYAKKFKDKSGLTWENRNNRPVGGKYTFIERSYDPDSDDEEEIDQSSARSSPTKEVRTPPESKLVPAVQDLMSLIFNQHYMAAVMADLNYDVNKMPLGKLSKSTILKGFQTLKDLAALFDDRAIATVYNVPYPAAVEMLSNQFYSHIPHAFGRNRPPIISTEQMLKRELDMLESLSDMKEAANIMKERPAPTVNPLDAKYDSLGMKEMSCLDHESQEFKLLEEYLLGTKGATHAVNYKVEEIFRIERQGETERFNKSKFGDQIRDRRLLWHGSRTTNFGGILSQGLRIAPPEAPVSGYMFGKGVYLADMSSKSANYCCAHLSNRTALLLLCEAELGDPMQELVHSSYNAGQTAEAQGMWSTWGQGRTGPKNWKDAKSVHPDLEGVMMPDVQVTPGDTGTVNASLLYNEYIAYDVSQIRLRYLFRVRM